MVFYWWERPRCHPKSSGDNNIFSKKLSSFIRHPAVFTHQRSMGQVPSSNDTGNCRKTLFNISVFLPQLSDAFYGLLSSWGCSGCRSIIHLVIVIGCRPMFAFCCHGNLLTPRQQANVAQFCPAPSALPWVSRIVISFFGSGFRFTFVVVASFICETKMNYVWINKWITLSKSLAGRSQWRSRRREAASGYRIVMENCVRSARDKSYATTSHIFPINRSHEVYGT